MAHQKIISLYLFLILFICPFFGVETFTPLGRMGHYSVLVENKLYFLGGNMNTDDSNEVFYLDVSRNFSREFPPFTDITTDDGIPFKSSWGTVSLSEQTIYL